MCDLIEAPALHRDVEAVVGLHDIALGVQLLRRHGTHTGPQVQARGQGRVLGAVGAGEVAGDLRAQGEVGVARDREEPFGPVDGHEGHVAAGCAHQGGQELARARVWKGLAEDVALGIGGVAAFVFGSLVLIDTEQPGYGISLPLVLTVGIASAFLMVLIIGMALKSQRRPVVSGKEELLGARGLVLEDFSGEGRVRVHGEVWAARCDLPLHRNQSVRIAGRDGLVLKVMPIEEE